MKKLILIEVESCENETKSEQTCKYCQLDSILDCDKTCKELNNRSFWIRSKVLLSKEIK